MSLAARVFRRLARRRPEQPEPAVDAPTVRRALAANQRLAQGRLPAPAMAKLLKIQHQIAELLPMAGEFPTGSRDLYVVQRTATDYLPATLQAYLALPPQFAATKIVENGKTALQLVDEQLDLLAARLDEIADAVHQQDSDRLLANGRFLEERFGSKSDLALPS